MLEHEKERIWSLLDMLSSGQAESRTRLEALEARLDRTQHHHAEALAAIRTDVQSIHADLKQTRDAEQRSNGAREAHKKWVTTVVAIIGILVAAGYFGRDVAASANTLASIEPPRKQPTTLIKVMQ